MRHSCTNPCIKKKTNKKQHSGKRGYVNERLIMQDTVGWRRLMHWNNHHNKGPSKGPCSHILPRGHTGIAGPSVPAGAAVWARGHAWGWPGCGDSTGRGAPPAPGMEFMSGTCLPGKSSVQQESTFDRKGIQIIIFFGNVLTEAAQQNSFSGECSTSFTLDMLLWGSCVIPTKQLKY